MKLNIAVLYGGNSSEKNVSIQTGKEIINNLDKNKYNIIEIFIPDNSDKSWINTLINTKIDVAFIALHGGFGENGSIQGLLEILNIPYIGSKVLASAIGMNKFITKELLKLNNIKVPKCIYLNYKNELDNIDNLTYPLVVKPNNDGSSVGVNIVNNWDELKEAINNIRKLKENILIEEYIAGVEVTCGIIKTRDGIIPLDVLDIKTSNKFYDYDAKYNSNDTCINLASLPDNMLVNIKKTAVDTFKILNSDAYARVDMIIKGEDIFVLEINTLPGMTTHSLIPKSLKLKDIEYKVFLDNLINLELNNI